MVPYNIVAVLLLQIQIIYSNSDVSKIVVPKCCAENEVIVKDTYNITVSCVKFNRIKTFSNLTIYNKDVHDKPTSKTFTDVFRVVPTERNLSDYYEIEPDNYPYYKPYLSEDGILRVEFPNTYDRWTIITNNSYCVDYELKYQKSQKNPILSKDLKFWTSPLDLLHKSSKVKTYLLLIAELISSAFLLLLLIVYLLLPELWNLAGKVLMAYVFSQLFAFLVHAGMQLANLSTYDCIKLTTTAYFFFLSSFCWINVMSYDIWWTFRGYAKARPIHRRGQTFKFLMYCIYGWGIPMVMSIAFVIINNTDMRHMPWFVKPMIPMLGCFLAGGQRLVYLYAPMLILILCNWIFFLMTAFNIWRLNRSTAVLDSSAAGTPQAHRSQRNRFFIYLKLSLIMGINWILEVVGGNTEGSDYDDYWIISDLYNFLIGPAVFLIFVCKKKIFKQLRSWFIKNILQQQSKKSSGTLQSYT